MNERDFSHERVERVMAILNGLRAPAEPMVAEVLWLVQPTAFTLPGKYLYISRRLIERTASDAPVAFVLAHEMAHHILGHLEEGTDLYKAIGARDRLLAVTKAASMLVRQIYSREQELAADAYALELCRKGGYDLSECLQCFDVLTEYALDRHDLDGVYGSDAEAEIDPRMADNPVHRVYLEAQLWRARHKRSHPSLVERRALLEAALRDPLGGTTSDSST